MKTGGSFKFGAIMVGWLVSVVGSVIAGGIVSAVMFGPAAVNAVKEAAKNPQAAQSSADTQAQAQSLANQMSSGSFPLMMIAVGCLFSILGGFVAARLAKQGEFKNGLAVGLLSMLLSLFFMFVNRDFSANSNAGLFGAIAPFIGVPLAAFGGFLGSLIRRPEAVDTTGAGSPPIPPA